MYELFLETEVATTCRNYANDHGLDEDAILKAAYEHTTTSEYDGVVKDSDWFVSQCLDGDSHKRLSLLDAFGWNAFKDYNWEQVYDKGHPRHV